MRTLILLLTLLMITGSLKAKTFNIELQNYSSRPEIQELISTLRKNSNKCLTYKNKEYCKEGKKDSRVATGWCYRYVKLGLLKSKMTSKYIGGNSAKNAGPFLEKEGFINILKIFKYTPRKLPVGSILVYGQSSKHGHIEVKIDENEYASDYVRMGPYHTVIAVYVKPFKKISQIESFLALDYQE